MGKKESNRDIRKKVFRYRPEDYQSVNYKQIKQIATDIALNELNRQCAVLMDICMMAYLDTMADIKESHPMIDKEAIDPTKYREKVEKYIEDYDTGIYNADQLKAYVGKYRIRKVYRADTQ